MQGLIPSALPDSYKLDPFMAAVVDHDTEILLTAGENGAFHGFKGNICHADAVECEVVDTTAAGDTFIGYYLACRHKGLSVDIAMYTACMASSLALSRGGAMKSIPFWMEIVL